MLAKSIRNVRFIYIYIFRGGDGVAHKAALAHTINIAPRLHLTRVIFIRHDMWCGVIIYYTHNYIKYNNIFFSVFNETYILFYFFLPFFNDTWRDFLRTVRQRRTVHRFSKLFAPRLSRLTISYSIILLVDNKKKIKSLFNIPPSSLCHVLHRRPWFLSI